MTKNAIISARILAAVGEGVAIDEAIDAVLGEGTYRQLVSDLYDELRARSGAGPAPEDCSG